MFPCMYISTLHLFLHCVHIEFWYRKKQQGAVIKEKIRLTEKTKRRRCQWTEERMNAAYTAVIHGTKTQRLAAKEFSVPRSTLHSSDASASSSEEKHPKKWGEIFHFDISWSLCSKTKAERGKGEIRAWEATSLGEEEKQNEAQQGKCQQIIQKEKFKCRTEWCSWCCWYPRHHCLHVLWDSVLSVQCWLGYV